MSSFFTRPASQRKRKRNDAAEVVAKKSNTNAAPRPRKRARDESISGSESEEEDDRRRKPASEDDGDDESDDAEETEADRRLKLAERYLESIRSQVGEEQEEVGFDAADVDRELIATRLKEDVDEEKGRLFRRIAGNLDLPAASYTHCRADTLATTAVASCPPYLYTASKDMRLIKWELAAPPHAKPAPTTNGATPKPPRRKPKQLLYTRGDKNQTKNDSYQHHTAPILCLAASADGRFLASGGADRRLIVWDAATLRPLKVFPQHRDAVTALAFRGRTSTLFSGSRDRTVKIFALDALAYVETLFGHQDEVVDVAAVGGSEERCVSVGARDRSARLWKVVDESQLVFRGGGEGRRHRGEGEAREQREQEGSLDRVAQLTPRFFVTGSDAGALSLFSLHKKKPLHVVPLAHGCDAPPSADEQFPEEGTGGGGARERLARAARLDAPSAGPSPRWITAMACVPASDLFVTGSWDGVVRVWRVSEDQRKIEAVGVLGAEDKEGEEDQDPQTVIRGVVNDLTVFERGERGKHGVCVVAAVGNETRLGRWKKIKKGRNGFVVFEIPRRALKRADDDHNEADSAS